MNEQVFNILDPNETLNERLFLEASAGTGKTFTIEHFVLRLMIEKGLSIDEILVVTFTNKATRELIERIEKLMEGALDALKLAEQNDERAYEHFPYFKAIRSFSKVYAHLEKNLTQFDKAAISTLHGFAHSALKKCDLGSMISHDETSLKEFISEQVSAECLSGSLNPFHIQKLKRRYPTADELFSEIERATYAGGNISPMPSYSELITKLLKRLETLCRPSSLEFLYEELTELGSEYKGILTREKRLKPGFDFPLKELYTHTQSGPWTLEKVARFAAAFEPIVKALAKANQKKSAQADTSKKRRLIESYAEAFYGLETYLFDPDVTLYTLASSLVKKKKELGYLHSPDDYLHRFEDLVKEPALKQQLNSQVVSSYRAVIIDEFQDTDPAQWTIFSNLFFSNSAIDYALVVGDPKQSIYGFRKADIYTFFAAKDSFSKASWYRLSTNFRSSPRLTETLNKLFSLRSDGTFLWLPKLKQTVPFTPSLSPTVETQSDDSSPIHAFISKRTPDLKAQEKCIFPWVYSEIINLIELGMLKHEIALLVCDRYQMQAVESYLSKRGLKTQCHRDLSLSERSDWQKLKSMLEALYSDRASARAKAALFMDQPTRDLFSTESKKTVEEAFRKARLDLQEGGLLHALLKFQCRSWIDSALLNLAEEFESFRSENGFLAWDVYRAIEAFEEDYKDEVEAEKGLIQVMTIHKSKGLEFGAVFALGLVQPSRGLGRAFEVDGQIKLKSLAAESEIHAQEEELDAEKLRAFYVCTTRAKSKLFMPLMTGERIVQGKASMNGAFFSRAFESSEIDSEQLARALNSIGAKVKLEEDFESVETHAEFEDPKKEIGQGLSNYALTYDLGSLRSAFEPAMAAISYSSLHEQKSGQVPTALESLSKNEPKGPEIGTQLHEVLRIIFERGWHSKFGPEVFQRAAKRVIPKSQLQKYESYFYTWVQKALTSPIEDIGPLKEVAWENLAVEQPFYLNMEDSSGAKIQGVIDLVVHHEGKIYIIDWKSNALSCYRPEDLEHAMHSHGYFLQASFYRYAAMQITWPWKGALFSKAVYFFVRAEQPVIFEPDLLTPRALKFGQKEKALCL